MHACMRVRGCVRVRVCMCAVACVCVELRVCACMCRQSAAQCESVSRRERAGVRAQPRARTNACECTPYGRRAPRCGSPAIRTSIVRPFVEARRPAWGFRSICSVRELQHHVGCAERSSSSSGSSSAESQRHIALQNAEAFPNRSFRYEYGRAAATTTCLPAAHRARRPDAMHLLNGSIAKHVFRVVQRGALFGEHTETSGKSHFRPGPKRRALNMMAL